MGRFAEGRFYGDVGDTVDVTFTDAEGQVYEQSLTYEKGQVMTTGTSFNLPSTGVSFVHRRIMQGIDTNCIYQFYDTHSRTDDRGFCPHCRV